MADFMGQKISLGLGGSVKPPPAPPPPPLKTAHQHVVDFSAVNLGKKVPQPRIQKIQGQTFRT